MGQRIVYYSDLSNETIEEGQPIATVYITYTDARRGVTRLEITQAEAEEMAGKGTRIEQAVAREIHKALSDIAAAAPAR